MGSPPIGNSGAAIGSGDKKLRCLDYLGNTKWSFTTGDEILSSPSIADIDNDGTVEIVFGSNDGKIYCLSLTGVSQSSAGQWYSFRGSRFHTGWMDSDSDYVDDLTEKYYYETDPYTFNPNFIPPPTTNEPTFLFPSVSTILVSLSLSILAFIHFIQRKWKKKLGGI